jgi:mono/diheme cytochrome c family protein
MMSSGNRALTGLAIIAILAAALAVGCKDDAKKPGGTPPPTGTKPTPPTPDAKKGGMRFVTVNAANAAKGQASYAGCAGCHGAKAEGKTGIAPRLASKSFLAAASDEFLIDTIKNGRAGTTMIPWKNSFKDEEIQNIIAWLRHTTPSEPVKLNNAPLKGDAANGEKLYRDICSACHGRSGAGFQETANGTGIGRKGFLDGASNGFIRYIAKNGKDQTAMRPFDLKAKTAVANLTDQEIDDVIAHLRKSAW